MFESQGDNSIWLRAFLAVTRPIIWVLGNTLGGLQLLWRKLLGKPT